MPSDVKNAKKIKKEFHCSYSGCLYNHSGKSFSLKKFLDQHIAKVHAEKKYFCEKCGKGFGLDWWRKHHEKTCGIKWMCYDCGSKYTSRESLLTHARRSCHDLPDHVLTRKTKLRKSSTESKELPMIIVVQPIIQNIKCDQNSIHNIDFNHQPILPKLSQSNISTCSTFTSSSNSSKESNLSSFSSVDSQLNLLSEDFTLINQHIECNQTLMKHGSDTVSNNFNKNQKSTATQTLCESILFSENFNKNNFRKMQVSTGTQIPMDLEPLHKQKESRASQCSRRKSKSAVAVGIESTYTQTAESAVVKIKKKRSRRKSVAITTEPNILINEKSSMQQSLWPNFKDLIFQNIDAPNTQMHRNTMSTQTNYNFDKILCDSETITDELLHFDWVRKDYESNICKSGIASEISDDIHQVDPLIALQQDMPCSTLPEFDLFPASSNQSNDKHVSSNDDFCINSPEINLTNKECSNFPEIVSCPRLSDSKIEGGISQPALSHIQTQTTANTEWENVLANMETQTTDEFPFYDLLEFSDTETQTPWNDFLEIDDSPLPPDQLSIEIQTDFSVFNAELDNVFDFLTGAPVQNMIDTNTERPSINIETQTQDKFTFPQLTNSESQTFDTIDMPDALDCVY